MAVTQTSPSPKNRGGWRKSTFLETIKWTNSNIPVAVNVRQKVNSYKLKVDIVSISLMSYTRCNFHTLSAAGYPHGLIMDIKNTWKVHLVSFISLSLVSISISSPKVVRGKLSSSTTTSSGYTALFLLGIIGVENLKQTTYNTKTSGQWVSSNVLWFLLWADVRLLSGHFVFLYGNWLRTYMHLRLPNISYLHKPWMATERNSQASGHHGLL